MSDPLQTTRTTLDALTLSEHAFQYMTQAQVRTAASDTSRVAKLQDRARASELITRSQLDVSLQRGRLVPAEWCADEEVLKRLGGKHAHEVWEASSTEGLDVRAPVPRLLRVGQEMVDVLPTSGAFPVSQASVVKAAKSKAFVGGGAHLALRRLVAYGPKRGVVPSRLPSWAEALGAMKRTGRYMEEGAKVAPLALAWNGRDEAVSFNADASNGFPVLKNMHDPYARELVLKLAGGLRSRLERAPNPAAAVDLLQSRYPEYMTCMGKAKTDLYNISKVSAGELRFYNTVPRQCVLIIQQASQPLAELWKEQSRSNYRTFIGKGMARGGAARLVSWLDEQLNAGDGIAWSHAGDDTFMVRVSRSDREGRSYTSVELFSLDCTAFDLTQHAKVTEPVHALFAQQLARVDPVSAALWHKLMRERDVTVSGAVVVRTRHFGASGMPLQSEVNDTLMEILCERLRSRSWSSKQTLAEAIEDEGRGMGFSVRLEEYVCYELAHAPAKPVEFTLERHPFLYVGYHLYSRGGVYPQIDLNRFMAGMGYLGGAFERDKTVVGVKVALVLAGYALSFGVPHPDFRAAFERLRGAALEAVRNKAMEINAADIDGHVSRYVYAQLGVSFDSVHGLVAALEKEPEELWGGPTTQVDLAEWGTPGPWADEPELQPWEREFLAPLRPVDLGVQRNEAQAVGPKYAGTMPPTPAAVLEERAQRTAARRDEVVEAHFRGRMKGRDKRLGIVYDAESDEGDLYALD